MKSKYAAFADNFLYLTLAIVLSAPKVSSKNQEVITYCLNL